MQCHGLLHGALCVVRKQRAHFKRAPAIHPASALVNTRKQVTGVQQVGKCQLKEGRFCAHAARSQFGHLRVVILAAHDGLRKDGWV